MGGVVEGVDVEGEMMGRRRGRLDEKVDWEVARPPEVGDRDGVLELIEGRLTGEVPLVLKPSGQEFEDGV